jgi:putative peptidoglycan lipid II flippase
MATAISAWGNAAALALLLNRRGYYSIDNRATSRVARTLAASGVMALGLIGVTELLREWLNGTTLETATSLGLMVIGGMVVYGVSAGLFGAIRFEELRDTLRRRPGKS